MKKILLLGGSAQQLVAIKAAKELGVLYHCLRLSSEQSRTI